MSASREKKVRQDMVERGIPDPKKIREEEEKRQQRRSNRLYAIIAIAFVVIAAALVVWNSHILQRSATALTVDGVHYNAAQVDYYYYNTYHSLLNSDYASLMGLSSSDSTTPINLSTTNLNDMAKMILSVEEDMTWDAYLKNSAKDNLLKVTKLVQAAKKDKFAMTDEMKNEVSETVETVAQYAKQYGYTTDAYLKALYGGNMTMSVFKRMLNDAVLANYYSTDHQDNLNYSQEDLEAYYSEHKNDFDTAAYAYISFRATAPSTTDDEGNTVEPTEDEQTAAKEAAKAAAEEALARVQNGESPEEVAADYDNGTYSSMDAATHNTSELSEWVFDSARTEGESGLVESDSYYYVVRFISRARYDYNTVDVRHILFMVDSSELDSESETYEEELAKLDADAKQKAEDALQQWKDGEATEDSFAALANELSDDTGSNTNGGLYEHVYKNQMVTEFNDWIFDETRQSGDTGIVYNNGNYTGYHVIYFVGQNDPYWMVQVRDAKLTADYNDWMDSLTKDAVVTEGSGMKYVG